jgi:hypothetical protein
MFQKLALFCLPAQLHTQVHVISLLLFFVCFFTLLQFVISSVCIEYDIILMYFVVNEIQHDGKLDKGYDKLQTKW